MRNLRLCIALLFCTSSLWAQDHCLSFDGSNDYLAANNMINREHGTWEAWVQKANWADHHDDILFTNGLDYVTDDCFYLSLHPSVGLHFRYGGMNQAGNKFISTMATQNFMANSWHHFAMVWNRDTTLGITSLLLYVDGSIAASDTTLAYIDPLVSSQCFIGGDPVHTYFGQGAMDNIRIWNEVRDASSIHYYSGKPINYPEVGLVGYVSFNTGSAQGNNTNLTHIKNLVDSANSFQLMNFALNGANSNLISTTRTTISYVEGVDGNDPKIQIHGTHLEAVTNLTIGSSSINSFLSNDSSTILISGTGNPNGNVSLSTPLGGYATSPYAFNLMSQEVLQFDGVNDYLKKDSLNINSDEGTWMAWVNKDNWQDQHMDYLFGNGFNDPDADAFYISLHSIVGIHVRYGGVYRPGNVYVADNSSFSFVNQRWQHLAVTWKRNGNSTTIKLFQSGMLIDSAVASFVIQLSGPFYIGGAPGQSSFGSGKMDDVQVWSVAKTPAEIMAHFLQSNLQNTPYPQPGLISLINFNAGYITGNNTQFLLSGLPDLMAPHDNFTFHNFALTGSQSNFTYGLNPLQPIPNTMRISVSSTLVSYGGLDTLTLNFNPAHVPGSTVTWQRCISSDFLPLFYVETLSSHIATVTQDQYYRCVVTIPGIGTLYSNVVLVKTYCASTASVFSEYLSTISFKNLDYYRSYANTYPFTGYIDLTQPNNYYPYAAFPTTTIRRGEIPLLTVMCQNYYVGDQVSAWIDFNHNGIFEEPSERYDTQGLNVDSYWGTADFAMNVPVPYTAMTGITRMRTRLAWSNFTMNPCGNSPYGETVDFLINIDPQIILNNPGKTIAPDICWGQVTTLSLENTNLTVGETFQWEQCNDSLFTGPITVLGSQSTQAITNIDSTIYYRCKVGLPILSQFYYSTPSRIKTIPFINCYCAASTDYNNCINSSNNEYISQVHFDSLLVNSLTPCNGFSDYTNMPPGNNQSNGIGGGKGSTSLIAGSSYPIQVSVANPYASDLVGLWIDFDHNSTFDYPHEIFYLNGNSGGIYTDTITIPSTALTGVTRMRIRLFDYAYSSYYFYPCGNYAFGETEDYFITILPEICSNLPAPGNTLSNISYGPLGVPVNLSLQQTYAGVNYQWQQANDYSFTNNVNNLGTNTTQTILLNASQYYRCRVACGNTVLFSTPVLVTRCDNESYESKCFCQFPTPWNNITITGAGNYIDTLTNIYGCDSVVHLHAEAIQASMLQSYVLVEDTICAPSPFQLLLSGTELNVRYSLLNAITNAPLSTPQMGNGASLLITSDTIYSNTLVNLSAEKIVTTGEQSLQFDGVDDYLHSTLQPSPLQGTWEAWVNKNDWATLQDDRLFGNGINFTDADAFYISLHPGVGLHFRYGGVSQSGNSAAASNLVNSFLPHSWHHIAATWATTGNTTTLNVYADGMLLATSTSTASVNFTAGSYMGGGGNVANPFFNGMMDEIRVWNYDRTVSQLQSTMYSCSLNDTQGLLAYWNLAQANGSTTTNDISSNSYHAAMMNFSAQVASSNLPFTCESCTNLLAQNLPVTIKSCNPNSIVNLKTFIQGYYIGASSMAPVMLNEGIGSSNVEVDTLLLELRDPVTLSTIATSSSVLQTNGSAVFTFTSLPLAMYYLVVKHRNSIETWSVNPVEISSISHYDFTTTASQAFGSNQVELEPGVFAIFTGDINQDGFVDSFDFPALDTDIFNGVSGVYVNTDLNGDGFVDSFDFPLFDANSFNGVSAMTP
jgi:hypothetical protein